MRFSSPVADLYWGGAVLYPSTRHEQQRNISSVFPDEHSLRRNSSYLKASPTPLPPPASAITHSSGGTTHPGPAESFDAQDGSPCCGSLCCCHVTVVLVVSALGFDVFVVGAI